MSAYHVIAKTTAQLWSPGEVIIIMLESNIWLSPVATVHLPQTYMSCDFLQCDASSEFKFIYMLGKYSYLSIIMIQSNIRDRDTCNSVRRIFIYY